ncbi:FAD-dependent oxidoreductase [Chlorogloea sp. CCALA 695]|uniref:FAD-dependent oxidoreductase n=1 Tax=Chlorogloea sp. CCALA 695 TaxID=2107693 RepID=UPI000D0587F3|nr:FAD-dependent oxidoreductase [Chlorogloea sp. CCALA 695]PSB25200.1 hypothetical protein C7B70_25000 [Chlorogloea sp. CCALA 695]
MQSKLFNRRKILWGLGLSALSSSLLFQDQVRANKTKRSPSVLVLGAGLSGLYTALLLERAGIKVVVLEGRDRVGGRVYTLDNIPGKPEGGGQGFSEKYQRLLDLAASLQVATQQANAPSPESRLYVRSRAILSSDWAASTANLLS